MKKNHWLFGKEVHTGGNVKLDMSKVIVWTKIRYGVKLDS